MSRVIAVSEDADGMFIGFLVDHEILECSECCDAAAYRLRYTKDQGGNLSEHRFHVLRLIANEHPRHSERIELPI
jgi:hypothetical protein